MRERPGGVAQLPVAQFRAFSQHYLTEPERLKPSHGAAGRPYGAVSTVDLRPWRHWRGWAQDLRRDEQDKEGPDEHDLGGLC